MQRLQLVWPHVSASISIARGDNTVLGQQVASSNLIKMQTHVSRPITDPQVLIKMDCASLLAI